MKQADNKDAPSRAAKDCQGRSRFQAERPVRPHRFFYFFDGDWRECSRCHPWNQKRAVKKRALGVSGNGF